MKQLLKKLSVTVSVLLFFCSSVLQAQDRNVTGNVRDENGQPIPGVNVLIKGTSTGSVTDLDGRFNVSGINENSVLVFSFVGYLSQEVTVGTQSSFDVSMKPDITQLGEVVVVGYGEQKKSLLTGAISSVKAEELQTVSVGRVDQALQGRTAGVAITPTSGSPGSGTKIRIRGTSSNQSADPLFIIDGVRTGASGMDFLSPNDIASMEILKDAASAAIYGAEGANGVVIITTKKGRANTSEITYSGQFGIQSVRPNMMKLMNAQQYQQYMEKAGVTPRPTAADVAGKGTDWFDEIFDNAPQQSHSLNFSGGTDKSTYFIAGNLFQQEGIAGGDKSQFNRYTIRINTSHKLKEWLTVGENLSYINIQRRGLSEDSEYGSLVGSALALDPTTPVTYAGVEPANYPQHVKDALTAGQPLVKDPNGNYFGISPYVKGEFGNPIARIQEAKGRTTQNKLLGNVYAEIRPIKGLKYTTRLNLDAAFQRNHNWNPRQWYSSESNVSLANGSDNWEEWYTWQWENFAEYNKSFADHNFTLLAGGSLQKYSYNTLSGSYADLFREEDKWSYARYVPDATDRISSDLSTQTLASVFGRLNYDYKGKYLFAATIRRDGSSKLASGHQWGTFPSVSAGWVVSSEEFFPENVGNTVSFMKIRASWGQNGSLSNLNPGQWQSAISTNVGGVIRYPDALGTYQSGAAPTQLENPYLTWETSEQLDLGLELRFIDDRLGFTVDYFNKITRDLITPGAPPGFAGNSLPFFNGGEITNKGFEFEASYRDNGQSALKYSISANLTTLSNEVTYLDRSVKQLSGTNVGTSWGSATLFKEGFPVWFFNGYATEGIFQNQTQIDAYKEKITGGYTPALGYPIIKDINNDGQINESDFTIIGSPQPDFYYGGRITLGYKGFDLLVFVQGQHGNDILMGFNRTDRPTANKPAFFYEDQWNGENSTNIWFTANTSDSKIYSSDYMIFNGSYARVRQLQLGYTLPGSIAENLRVRNVRAYVSFDNYFTFTKYPGIDPEAGSNNNNSQGIDRGVYPIPRTFLAGLTFTF
ncbi:SusC/RagA family TonB-linked outer membrane protein [Chryseosolibacter indicus]|uniref:TonB-dependent receptor n=1 Tax=Chryseosolibacter indicus TaxID=2782351 RepID=A0ABS5VWC2_9BACT|nr:TonB-dependent receptor [Chryseosolibacter indicus]MBT1705730.1 TonB-dependent receptor [Chryseosolibacter indicus]